jgi:hypothetical protein
MERRLEDLGTPEPGLCVLDRELPDRRALEVVSLRPGFEEGDPAPRAREGDREAGEARSGPEIDETRLVWDQRGEAQRVEDESPGNALAIPVTRQVDPRRPGEHELDQGREPIMQPPVAEAELFEGRRQEISDVS